MKCRKCFWHENKRVSSICDHKIPMDRKDIKEAFARCYDCGAVRHGKMNESNDNLYPPHDDQED